MRISDIRIWTDRFANPVSYEQYINSSIVEEYKAEDIIHFKIYPGQVWGWPIISTSYEDIMMLRRLEDNAILQSYQHAIPPILYQVPPSGASEIMAQDQNVINGKHEMEEMRAHGGLVTTTDAKLTMPTPGNMLNMTNYIAHAKSRVFAGLRLSPIVVGEGDTSNKATANVLLDDMITQAKYIQRVLMRMINRFIIDELLLEAPSKRIRSQIGEVKLHFPEIDIAYLTTMNNHYMTLFNAGLITRTEARRKIGYLELSKKQNEDTIFRINPSKQMLAYLQQTTAPENQHDKKLTAAPRASQNDENSIYDNLDIQNLAKVYRLTVQNSKLTDEEKNNLFTQLDARLEMIRDSSNNEHLSSHLSDMFRQRAKNTINLLNEVKNNDSLSIENIKTYNPDILSL
jgi:hypothetical protein